MVVNEPEIWLVDRYGHESMPKNKSKFISTPSWATEFVPKADYDKIKLQLDLAIDLLHRNKLDYAHDTVSGDGASAGEGRAFGEFIGDREVGSGQGGCSEDARAGEGA